MRAAPAVRFTSRDSRPWRATRAAFSAAAAAAATAWAVGWARGSAGAAAGAALMAALVAVGWAGLHGRRRPQPPCMLGWDGGGWWLEAPGGPRIGGRLRPVLDFGGWMLVRFDPDTGAAPRWLPVARRDAPASWPAWRAAVHAAAGTPELPGMAP